MALRARTRLAVATCLLVAAGCTPPGRPSLEAGTPTQTAPEAGGAPTAPEPPGARPGSPAGPPVHRSPGSGGPRASAPGGPGDGPGGGGADPDAGGLSALSRGFLRPSPYTRVLVQIDSSGDATPDSAVQRRLTGVLGTETKKPVDLAAGHHLAGRSCWSNNDIDAATAANRSVHTAGSTVTLYVLFLDGQNCENANVIGLAYGASAMAVFADAAAAEAQPTVDPDLFVKAVTTHELGHLLGLVNIGYHSARNHEDAAHPHHSSNPKSVMYWEIEQGNLIQQFLSGPPQDYDADDEADLAGLRNGTY